MTKAVAEGEVRRDKIEKYDPTERWPPGDKRLHTTNCYHTVSGGRHTQGEKIPFLRFGGFIRIPVLVALPGTGIHGFQQNLEMECARKTKVVNPDQNSAPVALEGSHMQRKMWHM